MTDMRRAEQPMQNTTLQNRAGFTLIELLVVVAVIAVLAGLLFPVFTRAREKARQTTCLSNMKQIAVAWLMYSEDYSGRACISYYWAANRWVHAWDFHIKEVYSQSDLREAHDGVVTDDHGTVRAIWRFGLLSGYTRTGQINSCPSFHGGKWDRPYSGYAYNASYIGGDVTVTGQPYYDDYTDREHRPCFLSEIQDPAHTALLADAGFGIPVSAHNYLRAPSDVFFQAGTVHFRHNDTATVAWADGHASIVTTRYTRYTDVPWLRRGQAVFETAPGTGGLSRDDSAYDLE